jgi:hypothetical protein
MNFPVSILRSRRSAALATTMTAALLGCTAGARDDAASVASTPDSPDASAPLTSSGLGLRRSSPTTERLAHGMLRVTSGEQVTYLKPLSDLSDPDKPRTLSYFVSDAAGTPIVAGAPGDANCEGTTGCVGALDLAAAYDDPTYLTSTATVAIIGFADNPNLESDMATYRSSYGLPACTSASGCFRKVNENGASSPLAAVPPGGNDWTGEEALDLAMVSAGCPTCKIVVIEGLSSFTTAVANSVATAAELGASAVSLSGGTGEWPGAPAYDGQFAALNIGLFASSGDNGGSDTTGELLWPAVSTAFTAVGGTVITASASGTFPFLAPYYETYRGFTEAAWIGANPASWGGSGWGCSQFEPKPSWQQDTGCPNRTVSDVSANAGNVWEYYTQPATIPGGPTACNSSVTSVCTGGQICSNNECVNPTPGWFIAWGTSAASPLVAGIYAQAGVANAGPAFAYGSTGTQFPHFIDITAGAAGTCPSSDAPYLCNAEPGYDGPTGNGSPFAPTLGSCMRLTCNEVNISCGTMSDGCGGTVTCGSCPAGEECGPTHTSSQACFTPAACVPVTCTQGYNCGVIPNECGVEINCGECPENDYCNGGFCTPLSSGSSSGGGGGKGGGGYGGGRCGTLPC